MELDEKDFSRIGIGILIEKDGDTYRFNFPKLAKDWRIGSVRRVTNHRMSDISPVAIGNLEIKHPVVGCVLCMAFEIYSVVPNANCKGLIQGYCAFVFNGGEWKELPVIEGIYPCWEGIQLADRSLSSTMLFGTWLFGDLVGKDVTYFPIDWILDYWAGNLNQADVVTLLRHQKEKKWQKVREALELSKSLRGIIRSKTAESIQRLLEEALSN